MGHFCNGKTTLFLTWKEDCENLASVFVSQNNKMTDNC